MTRRMRIIEAGPARFQMSSLQIDRKGDCSADSKDSIHGNRVGAAMVRTAHHDWPQPMNPEYRPAGSSAEAEHTRVREVAQRVGLNPAVPCR